MTTSTCARRASSRCSTCCAPSTRRPPLTATSAARSRSSAGSARTRRRPCAPPPACSPGDRADPDHEADASRPRALRDAAFGHHRRMPTPSLADLRRYAVARTLFAPTTLPAAIRRLGFVQADPIRAPARAQDLTLRHRVAGYVAGDL